MLKRLTLCAATVALLLTATSASFASIHTLAAGDQITLRYAGFGYRTGSGGEFQVDKLTGSDAAANYFHTFCAEIHESFSNNVRATVISTSLTSFASLPFNTLTSGAAKLYRDYFDGIAANNYGFQGGPALSDFALAGGDVTFHLSGTNSERAVDGRAVQMALWSMIGETVLLSSAAQSLVDWYTNANNVAFDANYYGVRFANLQDDDGNNLQDQFTVVSMPEPGSVLIWGALCLGCVARRRRSSQAAA